MKKSCFHKFGTRRALLPLLAAMLWGSATSPVRAVSADPKPFEFTQPDGSKVTLYLRGDEFFHWHEDTNGYTVVSHDGRFVYAGLNEQKQLVPTVWEAGRDDPKAMGLTPRALPPS